MFDKNTVSDSLQVSSLELSWLIKHVLTVSDNGRRWAKVPDNVFALTDFRARSGRFDIPWHPKSCLPVPDLDQPFDKKLPEIFDQRAIEIYNRAKLANKKIVIMWSGGIDSTSVVSAFIKNVSIQDLQSIVICTSAEGVAENPYFYETQIRKKFDLLHFRELDCSNEFFDQHILLHGDPGDCVFGPSVNKYKSLWSNNQHLMPWKNAVPILYQLYHDPQDLNFAGWYVDQVVENLSELQDQGLFTNINTVSDWHWWQYYNLKWQGSMTRPLSRCKKSKKSKISKQNLDEFFDLCFFAGADFQIWSYQNLATLCANEMRDHKLQAKNYIYELDKNSTYLFEKKKENSMVFIGCDPLVVDKEGVHHFMDDDAVIQTFQQLL